MQQLMLGMGAVPTKPYIDDVFSTYVYKGSGSARSINNGIDLSGKGGLVWVKSRGTSESHILSDTVRGANNQIYSNSNLANYALNTQRITAFGSSGFSLGTDDFVNKNDIDFASWTFRKQKGFFDVVTFTETSSTLTVNHSLGCLPGMVLIKRLDGANDWWVWHKHDKSKIHRLNTTGAGQDMGTDAWLPVTSTTFDFIPGYIGAGDGSTWVAYLFAGGESPNTLARSVEFDQSTAVDRLTWSATSDFAFGTGDMTVEFWFKANSQTQEHARLCHFGPYWNNNDAVAISLPGTTAANTGAITFNSYKEGDICASPTGEITIGQWHHVAVTRSSGVFRLFVDGTLKDTNSSKTSADLIDSSTNSLAIGGTVDRMVTECFDGSISNFRVVKGTAVYTSSFKPSTEPLTNITNTKLLCCNNSSVTGSTVTPGTISSSGGDARTDSPFDDPDSFKFGENKDQGVIKCGAYIGTGSVGNRIELGWEPSFILFKNSTDAGNNWEMVDVMRGNPASDGTTSQDANFVRANTSGSEFTNRPFSPYSTGFEVRNNGGGSNGSGSTYIYIAIRRPDGYVGKPPELGTDVFTMDVGNSSTPIPLFDSGFPVDFALARQVGYANNWWAYGRLIDKRYLVANTNAQEGASNGATFDSNVGFYEGGGLDSGYQAWMWKRGAGFDVVSVTGAAGGKIVPHSLGQVPEMYWIKRRGGGNGNWAVYNKYLNDGTTPEQWGFDLNNDYAASDQNGFFNDTAPNSTHFSLGLWGSTGTSTTSQYLVLLFASVSGISKCGYYTGNGSTGQTITTGFQPRFLIIKKTSGAQNWLTLDTTRGWGSGNENFLKLNTNDAQAAHDFGAPTSTGFTLTSAGTGYNDTDEKYIYYAHA